MATVKKYNLAGVSTSLELGKQGSYISGNSDAIGFYTSGDALQKIAIADARSGLNPGKQVPNSLLMFIIKFFSTTPW